MRKLPLSPAELALLLSVLRQHPEIKKVQLFGSRAKGTHSVRSDIDLALWGNVNRLQAETIAAELDDLPLPYRYDVQPFDLIQSQPLREHIERVGITLYPEPLTPPVSGTHESASPSDVAAVSRTMAANEVEANFQDLIEGRKDFWSVAREISREDLRTLVKLALRKTHGSYKQAARLFHIGEEDYRRLMDFLRRNDSAPDPRPFRKSMPQRS